MPRKIPVSLEHSEDEHANELVTQARKIVRVNDNNFEADWLISGGIGSKIWVVVENHILNTTLTVQFDDFLPDGSLLTDPQNSLLLTPIQKAAFHLREGNLPDFNGWHKQWIRVLDSSVNLARWLVLHAEVFHPSQYGFRLLTDDHLTAYFHEFASGGITSTLKLDDRLLTTLHQNTNSTMPLPELLASKNSLNEDFLLESARWLNGQGAYVYSTNRKTKIVSRRYLESTLGCAFQIFDMYPSIANIINQLDLQYLPAAPEAILLIPTENRLIVPVTPIVRSTMKSHISAVRSFTFTHRLVDEIPAFSESTFKETHLEKIGLDGHTKLIPLEVGLEAINKAAEMIICFGEQIVEAISAFSELYTQQKNKHYRQIFAQLIKAMFMDKLSDWPSDAKFGGTPLFTRYNVTSFTSRTRAEDIDKGITFKSLHLAFYGACAILIGMCKPIREGELHTLNLDCLNSEFEEGGAELIQTLEKSGRLGERQQIKRPIPSLTAKAIQLLQVLAARLKKIYGDEDGPSRDYLFYIPTRCLSAPNGKALGKTLTSAIDTFCVIADLPKEEDGKPRKIRVHEMRKFFLLVMHSHHEGYLRRTLSYAAGHIQEAQIDSYISFSHDDPERVNYESQCVGDRLISLERGCTPSEGNDGLCALYNHVCDHFNVHTIQSLSGQHFIRFLNLLQRSGTYKSTLYSIKILTPHGTLTNLEFAIKFEGKQDDKYH